MAATITGTVFNDIDHNGRYTAGEPGIPNVAVVLSSAGTGCVSTVTDSGGVYDFSVATPGVYTVYETVTGTLSSCPPSLFTQPPGFSLSNGPRKQTITVTEAQINNNETITGLNFSHDSLNSPFQCEAKMILFAGRPTVRYEVSPVSGRYEDLGTFNPPDDVNAIGYNPLDNYVYGYDLTENTIVRAGSDGTLFLLYPRPAGLPAADYTVGTIDSNGFYYLYVSRTNRFYTVDLRENSPTFMKLVDPSRGFEEQTSNFGTALSEPLAIGDWVFNPMDGQLYSVDINGVMQRIDPYSGTVTPLTTTGPNPGSIFGAMAIDANGTIFAVANDGTIYRYTVSGDSAAGVRFASTVQDDFSDAAMCPYLTIETDFGDAPDAGGGGGSGNYNTLLANNGPRHGLISPLYLGVTATAEEDAHQNATATGDDLLQGIQDDGLPANLPPLSPGDTFYTLPIYVTNYTPDYANLYAWIDFNKNGLFEADEAAPVTQIPPNSSGTYPVTISVPPGVVPTPGHTFVRLRLTTDDLTDSSSEQQDTRSVGPASDGEVEDYILGIGTTTDLWIQKTADLQVLHTGDTITYTISVNNAGAEPALNTVVTDLMPAELANPEFSLDGGQTWDHWSGALSLGTLNSGEIVTILLRGTFDGSTLGPVVNTASVTTTSEDPNPDNNESTVTTPVNRAANLSVEKTADRETAYAGELLTYEILVRNAGPDTAEQTNLIDAVPAQLREPEYSTDGGLNWYPWTGQLLLGDLPADTTQTIWIRGTVDAGASGTIINTAEVVSTVDDPDPSDNESTIELPIEASADLSISKTGSPNPVGIGQLVTYTIEVFNSGPADAQDVTLTEQLPASLSNPEYSIDGGAAWYPWSTPYNIGALENGAVYTLLLRAEVASAAPETILNTITVSSSTADPDPDNNSAEEEIEAIASADLSILKTADKASVISGEQLIYSIVIANDGPSPATNVTLTDEVPAGLSTPEFSLDGISWIPWVSPYNLGTIPPGGDLTVQIRGTVQVDLAGNLVNTAIVSSDEQDPDPDNNSSTVITPAEASADLSVEKTASPESVIGGEPLTYTITITNDGPSAAGDVVLDDAAPSGLTDAEFSTDNGLSWNPWTGSYSLGTVESGAQAAVLIRGVVSPSAAGNLVNTASVSSSTPDPDPDNNQSTVTTPITSSANLSVVKLSRPNPAVAGRLLTYTVVISNAGPSDAQNVTLADDVPSSLDNVEFSTDNGDSWSPWVSPYAVGTVSAGAAVPILIRGTVGPAAIGSISNTAVVDSTTPDPDPSDNSSTDTTSVDTLADLAIEKTASPSPVNVGGTLIYTLMVTNYGPSDAQSVTVNDVEPDGLENPEYSLNGSPDWLPWFGTINLGTLENGSVTTIQIRSTVGQSASGILSNTARVTSPTTDPNPENNEQTVLTPVAASADLSITKTGSPSPAVPGQQFTYTLTISNAGPDDAQEAVLTDTLPALLTGAEFSTDGGTVWNPWVSPYNVGTVASNTTRTVLIRAALSPDASGTLTNTASVTSATPDPDPDNNEAVEMTPIGTAADVSVVKTADPDPVAPGELLTYSIEIANAGPNEAADVVLTDSLPAAVRNPEYSVDGGASWNPWTGSHTVNLLAAGAQLLVLIRGLVAQDAPESLTNAAVVSSSTPDPDPDNNRSEIETPVEPSANVSISKTGAPNPAVPGQLVTYTIVASNAGPSDAQNLTIIDAVPAALEQPEYSADNSGIWRPWTGSYVRTSLDAGESVTLFIRGRLSLSASGQLTNTAVVFSQTPDPDPDDNSSTDTRPIAESADLSVLKNARPNPAVPGQTLTYILTVANAGPSDARDVVLTDTLSPALSGGEYSLDNGATWLPWSGSTALGTVASGVTRIVLLRGTVAANISGSISNTAIVSSSTDDPNPDNNSSSIVTPISAAADLSVRKTVNPLTAAPGGLLTYTVTVRNGGPAEAEDVTLSDAAVMNALTGVQYSLDNGSAWADFTGPVGLGTLAAGAQRTVLIRGTVPSTASGFIVNAAVAGSLTPDPDPDNNSDSIITPVAEEADLSVSKTARPNPAVPGETVTYTITIANSGPSSAQRVVLNDPISSSLSGVEFSADGGLTWNPWSSPYQAGTLAPGGAVTLLIRGTLRPSAVGQLSNTAVVTSPTPDPDPDNNTAAVVTPIQDTADLSIAKLAHPDPAIPGQQLTYTILVSNAGPASAVDAVLSDIIPAASYSLDGGVTWQPWNGSYRLGTVAPGAVIRVLLRVDVPADQTESITNTADVTSGTPDPNPDNNTVTVVTPAAETADLTLSKTGSPSTAEPGDLLTYTITVANLGTADAENVQLRDSVPTALENVEFSADGGAAWNPWFSPLPLGTVEDGGMRTILIRGTVAAEAVGSIVNTASVSSTTPDPDYTNNADQVVTTVGSRPEANLSVSKTVLTDPVIPGERLIYKVTVRNNGPAAAEDVLLYDVPDSALSFPEFSVDGGFTWNPWFSPYRIGTLENDGSAEILIRGLLDAQASGTVANTAIAASSTYDPDPSDNSAAATVALEQAPCLTITKTANCGSACPCQPVIYRIDVVNRGPNAAQDVVITDEIPAGLIDARYSTDGGYTWQPWSGSFSAGTLPAEGRISILLAGRVDRCAKGAVVNRAFVSARGTGCCCHTAAATVNILPCCCPQRPPRR